MTTLPELARRNHNVVLATIVAVQKVKRLAGGLSREQNNARTRRMKRNYARRLEQEDQWAAGMQEVSDRFFAHLDIEGAYLYAKSNWKPVTKRAKIMHAVLKAGTPKLEDIKLAEHTVQDVIDGKYKVGVEGNGGDDLQRAKAHGLYTTEVRGIGIYAKDKESAAALVRYLEGGGEYGTRQFSRLLGYSKAEIDAYIKLLEDNRAVPTAQGAVSAPVAAEVQNQLLASSYALDVAQGVQMYLEMALNTSHVSGQAALDHMGINKTFSWAHPRAMAQDLFAVRGSKVINNMYGAHLEKLSQIISDATDPRHPKTIHEVKKLIGKEWPKLSAYQVMRIARTETAAVWTATSANAYMANGITRVESLIAHGPSITIETGLPCDMCVDAAAAGPMSILGDLPPWHPHCRCEIVPVMTEPDGTEWFPPDEPWAGADMPICGSSSSVTQARRRERLIKMGAVLKAAGVPGACLTPMGEPGAVYGGETYYNRPAPKNAEEVQAYHQQINGWPEFQGDWSQNEVKAAARALITRSFDTQYPMKVSVDAAGELTSVAVYQEMVFSGYPPSLNILGIATRGSGARKVMGQFARDAYNTGMALSVNVKGVSPQLVKAMEHWGFKKINDDVMLMERDALKLPFKIVDEAPELPTGAAPAQVTPTAPVHQPAAPIVSATDETLDELKAKLYSTNNRIAGHRKKIKTEQAKDNPNPATISEFEAKLADEIKLRDELKQKISNYGTQPVPKPIPHEPPPTQAVPAVEDMPPPKLPPAENVTPNIKAANYDVEIVRVQGGEWDPSIGDDIREAIADWSDTSQFRANQLLHMADNAEAGYGDGLFVMRDADGTLRGVAGFRLSSGDGLGDSILTGMALKYDGDVEGMMRVATTIAKLTDNLPFETRLGIETSMAADASWVWRQTLMKRGMELQPYSESLVMAKSQLKAAFGLDGYPPPKISPLAIPKPKPQIEPAGYEATIIREQGQQWVGSIGDDLVDEVSEWGAKEQLKVQRIMQDAEAYAADGADGIMVMRTHLGTLRGVTDFVESPTSIKISAAEMALWSPEDVEGMMRFSVAAAKYAKAKGKKLFIDTELAQTSEISDQTIQATVAWKKELGVRGGTTNVSQPQVFQFDTDIMDDAFDLPNQPPPTLKAPEGVTAPSVFDEVIPEQKFEVYYIHPNTGQPVHTQPITQEEAWDLQSSLDEKGWKHATVAEGSEAPVIDNVSIPGSAPVPEDYVKIIQEKNLLRDPEQGDAAKKILKGAPDTETLYKVDGEWVDERAAVHAQIIADHFAGKTAITDQRPAAYMTAGGGASGKSSMKFNYKGQEVDLDFLETQSDVIYIDPDRIKKMIPEYKELQDAGEAGAAGMVHEESSIISKMIVAKARAEGYSVVIDTTGSSGRFLKNIEDFADADYDVKVSMVSIPTNEAISRSITRALKKGGASEGRFVAIHRLKAAHREASLQLIKWQHMKNLGEWRVYDNSGAEIKLIAEKKGKGTNPKIYDEEKFKEIKNKANEGEKAAGHEQHMGQSMTQFGVPVEQLKANLYSINNKIAGWKKKIKTHPEQEAEWQAKIDELNAEKEGIKQQIKDHGGTPTAAKPTPGAKPSAGEKPKPTPKPKPAPTAAMPSKNEVLDALEEFVRSPAAMRLNLMSYTKEEVLPTETQAGLDRMAVNLLRAIRAGKLNTKTLYRVDSGFDPEMPVYYFETMAAAERYKTVAARDGVIKAFKKGTVRGIRFKDYVEDGSHDKKWIGVEEPKDPNAELAAQPDDRRVIPGGITKERGTSLLNKQMQSGYTGYGATGLKRNLMNDLTAQARADARWSTEATQFPQRNKPRTNGGRVTTEPMPGDMPLPAERLTGWQQIREAFGYSKSQYGADEDHAVMAQLIHNWAITSSDKDWRGVAVHLAMRDEFNLNIRVFAADYWNDPVRSDEIVAEAERMFTEYPELKGALRAFLRAQYDTTQKMLDDLGVDEVTLYRGLKIPRSETDKPFAEGGTPWGPGLSTLEVKDNPIASWSIRHSISKGSYFYGGTMLRVSAPKEMIFSTPLTGFGCAREYEVLLINAGDNTAWVAQNGTIVLDEDRIAAMRKKAAEWREIEAKARRRYDEIQAMNNGSGPDWGTPEREELYAIRQEINQASTAAGSAERIADAGVENWSYNKESDLRAYISEALADNPALAGKKIKLPAAVREKDLSPQAQLVAQTKRKITGIKRKITNREKKMEQTQIQLDRQILANKTAMETTGSSYGYVEIIDPHGDGVITIRVYASDATLRTLERQLESHRYQIDQLRNNELRPLEEKLAEAQRSLDESKVQKSIRLLKERVGA